MASIRRPALAAAAALAALLAVTATACGPTDESSGDDSSSSAGQEGQSDQALPGDLDSRLKDLGVDLDKWKNGEWKNWDREDWLREANDFVNPIIKDLWKPDRMRKAEEPQKTVPTDAVNEQGVSDPLPDPVQARAVETPYHQNAAPVGKVFFDGPDGSMVCSATVVKDPANPGKSNMVWTAGHCVHAGDKGGWYRNITFVPSYNDTGVAADQIATTPRETVAPYGLWWADWASTSQQWISAGSQSGGQGAPYDFAVLHVKPENGGGKSLEETVGTALPVDFEAPAVKDMPQTGAWGYPAAPPFDGATMHSCVDQPRRLSMARTQPTMYVIGCTMTGGSSGGGWFADLDNGKPALVSNTSIGPAGSNGWLAGPHLGKEAESVYKAVSKKFAQ